MSLFAFSRAPLAFVPFGAGFTSLKQATNCAAVISNDFAIECTGRFGSFFIGPEPFANALGTSVRQRAEATISFEIVMLFPRDVCVAP